MGNYLERSDATLAIQISNFANKIDTYAGLFGFTAAETLSIRYDALFFSWTVNNLEKIDTYKKNWTAMKTMTLKGEGASATLVPPPPTLDPQPAAVPPGVLKRFTTMVNRVKAHQAYTTGIGQNLGIEVAPAAAMTVSDAKPALKTTLSGDKVIVQWQKGNFSGVLLEKDSGSGFVLLDKDFVPDYLDNSSLPPVGQTAIWKYRAIYLLKDEKVGQWSDEVSITITGR
ncbi:MAG: hypothetical protein WC716_09820 [Chitinophagaceae bacterium]|jgi:hypothetical protein